MKQPFRLFGIFGYPLSHTLSPVMQEAAFEALGLKAYYLAFELSPRFFRSAMKGLGRRFLLDGFNITVPYKGTVIPYLDRLTPEAEAVGAVNTVFRRGGKWIGANTDVDGFLTSLAREGGFKPSGKTAVVLGAGGAARAVAYALAKKGARKICVVNRPKYAGRRQQLIRNFQKRFPNALFQGYSLTGSGLKAALTGADLVVNATSVGVKFEAKKLIPESLMPKRRNGKQILFFDLVYHKIRTPFLKSAEKKGHRVLTGLGMLLHQGAKASEYWTGRRAPVEVMRRALKGAMAAKGRRP